MRRIPTAAGIMIMLTAGSGCERIETEDDRELAPATTDTVVLTPADSPLPEPDPGIDPTGPSAMCANAEAGYRVAYPSAWHTNPGDVMPSCSLFDPRPIHVPPATEIPHDIAVAIRREPVAFQRILDAPGHDDVEREDTEVDGRRAVRLLSTAGEPALLPPGTRSYRYFVDLDGATLVAVAHDLGEPEFETKRQALDRIMSSLRFTGDR